MLHVATLIAAPAAPVITDALVARAGQALPSIMARRLRAPGLAADILFTPPKGEMPKGLAQRVRAGLDGAPVDVVVQRQDQRGKRLFLADMDSTMIGQECIDELADYVGLKAEVSAVTERAMRGEIAFESALRERVALLKGLSVDIVEEIVRERLTLNPGGPAFVAAMNRAGAHTCLVSGGFTLFTARIAALIGFSESRGNVLEVGDDGRLLGTVREPILGREAKREALRELRGRLGLAAWEVLAIGDGANDLAMLEEAGLGVAYRAKPAVAAAAAARLDHADLAALLHVVGGSE